jgi:hypothetical protein
MNGLDRPWDDLHHISYFLLELRRVEAGEFTTTMNGDATFPVNPLSMQKIYANGNMESIYEMIPIDISKTHGIIENVFIRDNCSPEEIQVYNELFKEFRDVFAWYYEKILGIDPHIVEHEIRTYPDAKHVWKKLHPVNPHKTTNIKVEVKKLIKVCFIYRV